MKPSSPAGTGLRRTLVWAGLGVAVVAFAFQAERFADPHLLGYGDFINYWAPGRLNAHGLNPYSPDNLLPLQREIGLPGDEPKPMFYPPWVFPLLMPFGLLPFGLSRLLWLILNLGVVIFCADWIWRYFDGPLQYRWLAWLLSLVFVPTIMVLKIGQIGPLILLGVVGFLNFEKRGRDFLAGAMLALAALKPQLLYLFGLAVFLWAIDCRRWMVLGGGAVAVTAGLAVACCCNPFVLGQYFQAAGHPPVENITPNLGALLRLAIDQEQAWLQYFPTVAGLIWLPFYWFKNRQTWTWAEQGSLILMISFLTTAYGGWIFDVVILLLPVLQSAVWVLKTRQAETVLLGAAFYLVIDGAALTMNLLDPDGLTITLPWYMWVTPAILVCYLLLARRIKRKPVQTDIALGGTPGVFDGRGLSERQHATPFEDSGRPTR
jgi:hypothetical protein